VIGVESLAEVMEFLTGEKPIIPTEKEDIGTMREKHTDHIVDFSSILGQEHAKRALLIAGAGGHNIILQ